jgi:hypothetical protein
VRQAVLEEVARRLDCPIAAVPDRTMDEISLISDLLTSSRHHWPPAPARQPGTPKVPLSRASANINRL